MLDVVKYFMNNEFDKFLAEFPQDREKRMRAAEALIKLKIFVNKKERIIKQNGFDFYTYNKVKYIDCEGYDVVIIKTEVMLHSITLLLAIFGKDDSGVWVEVVDLATSLHSVEFLNVINYDDYENSEKSVRKKDVILNILNAGEDFSGREIPVNNDAWVDFTYRVQGDVNITTHPVSLLYETIFGREFLYNLGGLNEYLLRKCNLDITITDIFNIVEQNSKKDIKTYTIVQNELKNLYSDWVANRYLYKPMNMFNFENHKITIFNAHCIDTRNRLIIKTSADDDSFIIIESPHHKTVQLNLKFGLYALTKSGGMPVEDFEITVRSVLSSSFSSISSRVKKIVKEVKGMN